MAKDVLPNTFGSVLRDLTKRLEEPAPGRIQLLTGPRQVGKTTLLLQLERELGSRSVYAAADAPEASLSGWWELQWSRAEEKSRPGPAILLLDEIQYLPGWSRLLKSEYDETLRHRVPVHVVVTGSSALDVGRGAEETMAGRFERSRICHWPAAELAAAFGLEIGQAVEQAVRMGGYPGAVSLWGDLPRWRAYVRDSVIEPAIGRDVFTLESVRKPALLRQLFAACVGHPAEILSLQKLCGMLLEKGALETVAHYLTLLEKAYLIAALQKYSGRAVRRRSAPPKLLVLNQAILAASGTTVPSPETEPERWGRWVENACLSHAWNSGQEVSYWREEPLEVDAVFDGSWGRWAVEVKTSPFAVKDLAGLLEFCRRYPAFKPVLLCEPEGTVMARRAGFHALSWKDFLASGLGF